MKKAFRMGELLHTGLMYARVKDIVEWKNLTVAGGYHHTSPSRRKRPSTI